MNIGHTIRFIARNPAFCIQSVRKLPAVIKAMNQYRKANPFCAYCGKAGIDVHHCLPVHLRPDLAAVPSNFISLNRSPDCHLQIGHLGNWDNYNPQVRIVCADNMKKLGGLNE